jgi:hypothetical protein
MKIVAAREGISTNLSFKKNERPKVTKAVCSLLDRIVGTFADLKKIRTLPTRQKRFASQ